MPSPAWTDDPDLKQLKEGINTLVEMLTAVFKAGGRLYICGNGGSFADSLHICGELLKSFEAKRPLTSAEQDRFKGLYGAETLTAHLENGLPAMALGANPSLATALLNDCAEKEIVFAQELYVLGTDRDMLLAISTSGNARDILLAVSVARAKGMRTAALTGKDGGGLKTAVETALIAPGRTTAAVQQVHQKVYHTVCRLIEGRFYG